MRAGRAVMPTGGDFGFNMMQMQQMQMMQQMQTQQMQAAQYNASGVSDADLSRLIREQLVRFVEPSDAPPPGADARISVGLRI